MFCCTCVSEFVKMSESKLFSLSSIEESDCCSHRLSIGYILSGDLCVREESLVSEANPVRIRKKLGPRRAVLGTAAENKLIHCCAAARGNEQCY